MTTADLVDRYNPGEVIVVVGTLLRQWRPLRMGTRCNVDVRIRANSLHSLNTQVGGLVGWCSG